MANNSTHARAARRAAEHALEDGEGDALAAVMAKARSGTWPQSFIDAFYDRAWGGRDLGQTYSFAKLLAYLAAGEVGLCSLEVGETPHRDSARWENAASLLELPTPFVASVDLEQNCGDDDGELRWDETVRFTRWVGREQDDNATAYRESAPLEIGSSAASRTLLHLQEEGAVARWPYDSDRIWIAARLEPYHANLERIRP